jgi:hypothetical protein
MISCSPGARPFLDSQGVTMARRLALIAFCCMAANIAHAEEKGVNRADKHWYDRFEVGGFVNVYYAVNTNTPDSHDNFIPGYGTTAKKHNEFSLNLAAIRLIMRDPFIVRLIVQFGPSTDLVHSGEPTGTNIGPDVWKYIQQAYLGYKFKIGRGLTVLAGIMPSPIGYEYYSSNKNWNYTRSWMVESVPYYQAGLALQYPFTDKLSAQLFLVNGWGIIGEDNGWKTFGAQVYWNHPRYSLTFNTMMGPEQPHQHDTWRFFFEVMGTVNLTDRVSLAAIGDWGLEQMPVGDGDARHWGGAALYGRVQVVKRFAIAARAEVFKDGLGSPDNVPRTITGTEQTLAEGTLTLEVRPVEGIDLKLEGRYDHSTAEVFDTNLHNPLTLDPIKSQDQGLVVLGAVAAF